MPPKIDLTGQRFGSLLVIDPAPNGPNGATRWNCICDCGSSHISPTNTLRRGEARTCGCSRKKAKGLGNFRHGMNKTKIMNIWRGMMQRCFDKNTPVYHRYGGRGITVCERWRTFAHFYHDMREPPDGTTLDRVDNDGGYSPENTRWATPKEQSNNRRSNRLVTVKGISRTVAEWGDVSGIPATAIWKRIFQRGWEPVAAVSLPLNTRYKNAA